MKKKILVIISVLFSITLFCGCYEKDETSSDYQPIITIGDAEIAEFHHDLEYNKTRFKFDYEIAWEDLPSENEIVKYTVKFFKNDKMYATWEFIGNFEDRYGSATGTKDGDLDGIQPVPDRYIVEVQWQDKLVDSIEKEF